jgi:hypothetical protein
MLASQQAQETAECHRIQELYLFHCSPDRTYYFLSDTAVTHQVEVRDTPWIPLCFHTLLTQMGTVSCLAGLTTLLTIYYTNLMETM